MDCILLLIIYIKNDILLYQGCHSFLHYHFYRYPHSNYQINHQYKKQFLFFHLHHLGNGIHRLAFYLHVSPNYVSFFAVIPQPFA